MIDWGPDDWAPAIFTVLMSLCVAGIIAAGVSLLTGISIP